MKKTVLMLLLDQFADWEAAYLSPWIVAMGQDQYTVKTVSLSTDPIHSMGGFTVIPDYEIASVPNDYEGLILVGGLSWRSEDAQQVIPLVKQAWERNKVLGGICDAAGFLGTIGILNQVQHTCNDLDDLKQWAGAAYTGEEHHLLQQAVRDGKIVTANGTAPLEFAKEVILALGLVPEEYVEGWYDFYKLGYHQAPMPQM